MNSSRKRKSWKNLSYAWTALRVPGGNLVDGLPPARQDGQKRNLPLWEQFQSGLSADATLWRPSPTDHSVPATCYPKQITGSFLFSPVSVYRNWFEKAWPKQKGSFKVAVGTILDSAHFCFCFRFRSSVAFVLPFSHLSFCFFHCSNCPLSCVVLFYSTCVMSCLFSCVSSPLSVVLRSSWSRGCVASQCSGASVWPLFWPTRWCVYLLVPTMLCCVSCPRLFKFPFTGQVLAVSYVQRCTGSRIMCWLSTT